LGDGVIMVQVVLIDFHFAREMNSKSSVHVLEMVTQTITEIIQTKTGKRLVYISTRSIIHLLIVGFLQQEQFLVKKKSFRLLRVKLPSIFLWKCEGFL
jgi:ABC-type iron transport system FetAB permease component